MSHVLHGLLRMLALTRTSYVTLALSFLICKQGLILARVFGCVRKR